MKNMTYYAHKKILYFKLIFLTSITLYVQESNADSYLRTMGEAYQQQYREIQKLGPNPSSADIQKINQSLFSHSNEIWRQEKKSIVSKYLELAKTKYIELNNRLRATGLLEKLAKNAKNSDLDKQTPANTDTTKKQSDLRNASSTAKKLNTGDIASESGARGIELGNKRETQKPSSAPKNIEVIDGIIQNR